ATPVSPGVASSSASLPLRSLADNARTLDAAGNARLETVRAEGLAIEADLRRAFAGQSSIDARLCGLRVGPWSLLSVPGEAFSDLAVSLRAANRQALVVG